MTADEPRRTWRIIQAITIGEQRYYLFDNFAPVGPHQFIALTEWFWGKAHVQ